MLSFHRTQRGQNGFIRLKNKRCFVAVFDGVYICVYEDTSLCVCVSSRFLIEFVCVYFLYLFECIVSCSCGVTGWGMLGRRDEGVKGRIWSHLYK